MGNEYFMGGQMPYRPNSYAPSFLSTQMMPPTTMGNNNTNIVWTMGMESAKAYPLMPGRTVMLMDSESPRFFIKSVDNNGYATMKAYSFQEEQMAPQTPSYVTKEQLDAAISAVLQEVAAKASSTAENTTKIVDTEEVKTTKNLL